MWNGKRLSILDLNMDLYQWVKETIINWTAQHEVTTPHEKMNEKGNWNTNINSVWCWYHVCCLVIYWIHFQAENEWDSYSEWRSCVASIDVNANMAKMWILLDWFCNTNLIRIEPFSVFMLKPHTLASCTKNLSHFVCCMRVANARDKSVQSTKVPHQTKDAKAVASSCNVIWNCKPHLHFITLKRRPLKTKPNLTASEQPAQNNNAHPPFSRLYCLHNIRSIFRYKKQQF